MRPSTLVMAALATAALCVSAHGAQITLTLDVTPGTWRAYAQADATCNGIASFIVDVKGVGGDASVTGSTCMAPRGYDAGVGAMFGFANFSNYDTSKGPGIGIRAGQPTAYSGGNDPTLDSLVLRDVGISAGSHLGTSWAEPVLLAQGTYSGSTGQLTLNVGDGFFNVLDPSWTGPGHVSTASVVLGSFQNVPEPSTLALLPGALGLLAAWRQTRRCLKG
jgi:hypothetical protein